jgi:hypothetical protein
MSNLGFFDALYEARVVVQQHYGSPWYDFGWAAIALAVIIGGLFVVYIIYYLLQRCCFPSLYRKRWIPAGRIPTKDPKAKKMLNWLPETRKPLKPYIRVAIGSFFVVGCIFAIWAGMNVAGFNYISSPVNQLALSLIGTYMFASAIRNFGAGYWNNVEDKIEENWWVELPQFGPKVKGYIKERHGMFVELHYMNERGFMVDVQVPNTLIGDSIVIREHEMEIPKKDGGKQQHWYKDDSQVKYDMKQQKQQQQKQEKPDVVFNMMMPTELRKKR